MFSASYELLQDTILDLDFLNNYELYKFFETFYNIEFIFNSNNNLIALKYIDNINTNNNNSTNVNFKPLAENIILNKSSENNSNKFKDYIMIYTNI